MIELLASDLAKGYVEGEVSAAKDFATNVTVSVGTGAAVRAGLATLGGPGATAIAALVTSGGVGNALKTVYEATRKDESDQGAVPSSASSDPMSVIAEAVRTRRRELIVQGQAAK